MSKRRFKETEESKGLEYTFENWLEGKFKCDTGLHSGDNKFIPSEEYDKIDQEQKRIFNSYVENQIRNSKQKLNSKLIQISNKQFFIDELSKYINRVLYDKSEPFISDEEYLKILPKPDKEFVSAFRLLADEVITTKNKRHQIVITPIEYGMHGTFNNYALANVYAELKDYLYQMNLHGVDKVINQHKVQLQKEKYQTYRFYVSKSSDEKIENLFYFLKTKKYIKEASKLEKFKIAFSGNVISEKLKIVWLKEVKTFGVLIGLLIYFDFINDLDNYNSIAINNHLFYRYDKSGNLSALSKIKSGKNLVKLNDQDLPNQYIELQEFVKNL